MDLFILRHGEAGDPLPNARQDRVRSLTGRGKDEVQAVANSLKGLGYKFDHIFSSPLPRAIETAEIVGKRLGMKVELWDELSPGGESAAFLAKLGKIGHDSRVLVVGHEPSLTTFVSAMTGTREGGILLKKAGLIRVRVASFSPARAELRWLLSPKLLKALS